MQGKREPDATTVGQTVQIGRLEPREVHRCAALEKRLFADESPWPAAAFAEGLRMPHMRFYAAREPVGVEDGGAGDAGTAGGDSGAGGVGRTRLIGFAAVALLGRAGSATCESEVHTMAVEPEAQGQGVGRMLLDALLAEADAHGGPVFLDVRDGNAPAIGLYRSAGFEPVGMRPRYYQPVGADAIVMRRPPAADSADARRNDGEGDLQ